MLAVNLVNSRMEIKQRKVGAEARRTIRNRKLLNTDRGTQELGLLVADQLNNRPCPPEKKYTITNSNF